MGKYAILFAGCVNQQGWNIRYHNDLAFMHTILKNNNYKIITLYYDGRDINLSNNMIKTHPCTLEVYDKVISQLKRVMKDEDSLIFFASNHGGFSEKYNMAYINCLGNEGLFQKKFESDMNSIPGNKVIVLGQCYGGDFLNCNINDSIIMSANKPGALSFAGHKNRSFDEFLYHFMAYLWGSYPDGSSLNLYQPWTNNFQDAFMYARINNHYFLNPGQEMYLDDNKELLPIFEEPQMKVNTQIFINI